MLTVRPPTRDEAERYRKGHLRQAGFYLFVAAMWLAFGLALKHGEPWMRYFDVGIAIGMVLLALRERKAARQYDVS